MEVCMCGEKTGVNFCIDPNGCKQSAFCNHLNNSFIINVVRCFSVFVLKNVNFHLMFYVICVCNHYQTCYCKARTTQILHVEK